MPSGQKIQEVRGILKRNQMLKLVKELLENNLPENIFNDLLDKYAVQISEEEINNYQIIADFNLENRNIVNQNFRTICNLKKVCSDVKVINFLTEKKRLNLNKQDAQGNTLLHLAWIKNDWNLAAILTDSGASLDIQNNFGETPIHIPIKKRRDELIEYQDTDAIEKNLNFFEEFFEHFVELGADLEIRDNEEKTVLDIVQEIGDLYEQLTNPVAKVNSAHSSDSQSCRRSAQQVPSQGTHGTQLRPIYQLQLKTRRNPRYAAPKKKHIG